MDDVVWCFYDRLVVDVGEISFRVSTESNRILVYREDIEADGHNYVANLGFIWFRRVLVSVISTHTVVEDEWHEGAVVELSDPSCYDLVLASVRDLFL